MTASSARHTAGIRDARRGPRTAGGAADGEAEVMPRWKLKLALASGVDYERVAAALAAYEVQTWRLTSHILDTIEGACAAAGWCVRIRRSERRSGRVGDVNAQSVNVVAAVRPHSRELDKAVAEVAGTRQA